MCFCFQSSFFLPLTWKGGGNSYTSISITAAHDKVNGLRYIYDVGFVLHGGGYSDGLVSFGVPCSMKCRAS